MNVVHVRELALITSQGAFLQFDRRVDFNHDIRKQGCPDFIATALEIVPCVRGGRHQHLAGGAVIHMILQKERQIDDVRPFAFEKDSKPIRHQRIGAQPAVLGVQKGDVPHSEYLSGTACLLLSDVDEFELPALPLSLPQPRVQAAAVAAVRQKDDPDIRSRLHVSGDRSAATQNLVVHVGRQHDDLAALRLPHDRALMVNRRGAYERLQTLRSSPAERLDEEPYEQMLHVP